jgi:hypothetical protein
MTLFFREDVFPEEGEGAIGDRGVFVRQESLTRRPDKTLVTWQRAFGDAVAR